MAKFRAKRTKMDDYYICEDGYIEDDGCAEVNEQGTLKRWTISILWVFGLIALMIPWIMGFVEILNIIF